MSREQQLLDETSPIPAWWRDCTCDGESCAYDDGDCPLCQRLDHTLPCPRADLHGIRHPEVMEISKAQRLTWTNKLAKGFNTTDVPLEFCLLQEELSEAFHAWRRGEPGLGSELADVAIFLFSIAEMNHVDLDSEVRQKIETNAGRRYTRSSGDGYWQKEVAEGPS